MSKEYLTIEDLKKLFHIGNSKAYKLCETVGFPAFRIGESGRWLIDPDKLDLWIAKIYKTKDKTWELECLIQTHGSCNFGNEELLEIFKLLEADYD